MGFYLHGIYFKKGLVCTISLDLLVPHRFTRIVMGTRYGLYNCFRVFIHVPTANKRVEQWFHLNSYHSESYKCNPDDLKSILEMCKSLHQAQ